MGMYTLLVTVLVLLTPAMMADNLVRGSVDDTLTLPCRYSVIDGPREVCWGKGGCPLSGCKNKILTTDGTKVTWSESSRYKLLGNISHGDSSLTISGLSKDQEGTYCCRVRIPGMFNDIKNEIKLEIQDGLISAIHATVGDSLTLPCLYLDVGRPRFACWGRGPCSETGCNHPIATVNGSRVTWTKSTKYEVIRDISNAELLLTITDMNLDDSGTYCCHVRFLNWSFYTKSEIPVEVHHYRLVRGSLNDTLVLPCSYSTDSGTSPICWGRGHCGLFGCDNTILENDGDKVTCKMSKRYQLDGNLAKGNVSLTIKSAKAHEAGVYCCRVEIPGLFNDIKKEIRVEIRDGLISAYRAIGVVGSTLVLPCEHPEIEGTIVACWGRGPCSQTGCNHPVVKVNGNNVIWTKSIRYQVNRDISKLDRPLTITDVNVNDTGKYCCHLSSRNVINMKREVEVEILSMMAGNLVRGSVDDTLTLPCKYSVIDGPREVCWGKGGCPFSGCRNKILTTDGTKVTWSESSRYKLLGNISHGDSSLTISGLSKDQEGKYCCRVRTPGFFNDIKNEIKLEIQDVHLVKGSVNDTLVIPCSYSTDSGKNQICWGRGHCGLFNCHNTILESEGGEVIWTKSKKYKLDGNLAKGNVSLTIESANADDGGVYCCRVDVPGAFNDIMKEIRVEIRDEETLPSVSVTTAANYRTTFSRVVPTTTPSAHPLSDTVTLPCKYNVEYGASRTCWIRGSCPVIRWGEMPKCTNTNTIISTDGHEESGKYMLKENLKTGDVPLTINRVTKEDEGFYCCLVELPTLNVGMSLLNLEVIEDLNATHSGPEKHTLVHKNGLVALNVQKYIQP